MTADDRPTGPDDAREIDDAPELVDAPELGDAPELDDAPLDPEQMLAIIREQRRAVRDRYEPDPRLLFGGWGIAWLAGYLTLYLTARTTATHTPTSWSLAIFFGCIGIASAVTIVHIMRRASGVAGPSGTSGAMYGMAWTIGFVAVFLIMTGLDRAGASPAVMSLGWNALACLLVGMLYLAGGAMWQSPVLYALGTWIVLVGGVATVVGVPTGFLVMALAGGGGMLLGALVTHVREYRAPRSRRAAGASA